MATLCIILFHILRFKTPSRAEAICYVPTSTELSAAIDPAAVTEYTLTHIFDDADMI